MFAMCIVYVWKCFEFMNLLKIVHFFDNIHYRTEIL